MCTEKNKNDKRGAITTSSGSRHQNASWIMSETDLRRCVVGVDLGGTKIETALVDAEGKILSSRRKATNVESGPDSILQSIVEGVREITRASEGRVLSVGIGVAGQVDAASGIVRAAPNLGWHDVPMGAKLSAELETPVHVTNDVRAATWGEWRHGAGKGMRDIVCVFVGTGIGGGVVIGGKMIEGHTNTAGEIGHTPLVFDGRKCTCPGSGCLEAYAGGWAIAERARDAARGDEAGARALLKEAGGLEKITASDVGVLARKGDPLAMRLMADTAEYLSAGIAGLINAFNPEMIIFGGGVIEGNPEIMEQVEKSARNRALSAAVKGLAFVKALLGKDAGVVGAAAFARHKTGGAPSG